MTTTRNRYAPVNGQRNGTLLKWLTFSVAACAMLSVEAVAQETGAAPNPEVETSEASAPSLDVIVVTAQRRSERLQDVPVAITVADSEALAAAQVDNIATLKSISPSVGFQQTNNSFGSPNVQIRGIGTVGNSRTFEGAVGIFVDGVYRSRAGQALQNWLDIDQVQILRGPQGTLFGRNTSAGAILINSTIPELGYTTGNAYATIGNYNSWNLKGAINLPIGNISAIRIAGSFARQDGFLEDPNTGQDYNGNKSYALKGQWLIEPTDTLSIRVLADWSRSSGDCCYATVDAQPAGSISPTQGLIDLLTVQRGLVLPSANLEDYETTLNSVNDAVTKDRGVNLYLDWEVGSGSLRSVTSYRAWNVRAEGADSDFTGADLITFDEDFRSRQFSQELTYLGTIDEPPVFQKIEYVLGAFYSNEKVQTNRSLFWGDDAQQFWDISLNAGFGFPFGSVEADPGLWESHSMSGENRSLALFSHFTFHVTDNLRLITGLRFTDERRRGRGANTFFRFTGATPPVFIALGVLPGPDYSDTFKDNAFSGTAGLQYRLNDDMMAYATYSRGFKSGGVNLDPNAAGLVANNPAFTPGAILQSPNYLSEFVNGYELGLKTEYLDRRARTNIAFFYNDIKDLQVAQFQGLQFVILNAPKAEVYGAEIENFFQITDALSFQLDATYLARVRFGTSAALGAPLSGRDFSNAPKWAVGSAINYEQPLSDEIVMKFRGALRHVGSQFTNPVNNARERAVTQFDASIGFASLDDGWSASLFCTNCTDERYIAQHFNTPLQAGDINGFVSAPRKFGMSFRKEF